MDYSWIGKHARLLAGSYLLFMVLMRHFFALQINGAVRWIGVGGFSVSLSLMGTKPMPNSSQRASTPFSSTVWCSVVSVPGRRIWCCS